MSYIIVSLVSVIVAVVVCMIRFGRRSVGTIFFDENDFSVYFQYNDDYPPEKWKSHEITVVELRHIKKK